MSEFYQSFQPIAPDPILGLVAKFKEDSREEKLNLTIGVYKSEDAKILVLDSVRKAEQALWKQHLNKGYPPVDGGPAFKEEILKIIAPQEDSKHFYIAQTVGATSAIRLASDLMNDMGVSQVAFSDLTWPNHPHIFRTAGLKPVTFEYYDAKTHSVKIDEICQTLQSLPRKSAVLFQMSCHNPTGKDPTRQEWARILDHIKEQELFLVFDCAYQGFGEGLTQDIAPFQWAIEKLDQVFLCYSCAKNFGVYGERLGAFIAFDKHQKGLEHLGQNARVKIRGNYSTPPIHGARIVSTILESVELKQLWEEELSLMRSRVSNLRSAFVESLISHKALNDPSYILEDKGLFSLMDMSRDQLVRLREEAGIYLVENGRINIAALNAKNINHVAASCKKVIS